MKIDLVLGAKMLNMNDKGKIINRTQSFRLKYQKNILEPNSTIDIDIRQHYL